MKYPFSKDALHHAYILTGNAAQAVDLVRTFIEKELKMEITGHPDISIDESETLTIDDSRKIKERHSLKSFGPGGKRITLISTKGIPVEAQNSLLKLFEEPVSGTHFFLVVPVIHVILPTLRSRALHIHLGNDEGGGKFAEMVPEFLKGTLKDRLDLATEIAKEVSDEHATKSDVREFISALIKELSVLDTKDATQNQKNASALRVLLDAERYISDRGSSVKLLLENIAINL